MKIKVLKTAYFNQKLLNVGEIIDFKGKKLPSWGTLADGIETKKTKSEAKDNSKNGKKEEKTVLNDEQKKQYLEMLLNDAIEKGILIEDADTKTVDEQIKELEEKLKGDM